MTESTEAQAKFSELLRDNPDKLPGLLHSYWHRSAADFVAAGLDRPTVADSLFTVAVAHKIAALGMEETIKFLRAVADFHELHMTVEQMKLPATEH